jgi:hypothetical protein
MVNLIQASTATPQNNFSATELVASMMHKLSPELRLPFFDLDKLVRSFPHSKP